MEKTQPTESETKVEDTKVVATEEPQNEDVQSKGGNSALRKKLIEANKRIAELETNSKTEVELPKAAIEILKSLSDDEDTADKIARALSEMSKAQLEAFMKERETLTTKAEKQQQLQELEAEQLIEDVIEEYEVKGIKITRKELEKAIREEFGDDEEILVDERSVKMLARLIAKDKQANFAKDAGERKEAASKVDKLSEKKETAGRRIYDPRTGRTTIIK